MAEESMIESRPEVRGGEPCLRGTRIPARLVAGLVQQGARLEELERDYGLTPEQVEAALGWEIAEALEVLDECVERYDEALRRLAR